MATLCPPRRCEVVGIYTAGCSRNTLGACAAGMGNDCLAHMLDSCFPLGPFGTCRLMLCIGSFTFMSAHPYLTRPVPIVQTLWVSELKWMDVPFVNGR